MNAQEWFSLLHTNLMKTFQKTDNGFREDTYQLVPSLLLNDLRRKDACGKPLLEHTDIVVYALLKAYAWQKDSCYPSYETLARQAACGVGVIRRSLLRLENAKHILRKSQNQTGNIFLLTDVVKGKVTRQQMKAAPRLNPFKKRVNSVQKLPPPTPPRLNADEKNIIGIDSEDAPF